MAQRIDLDLAPLRQRRGELGASTTTISLWQNGHSRPQVRFMPKIAEILNVPLSEVVQAFWKEKIGDPCPCGCPGKQVFSEKRPNATTLAIEIPCECEVTRIRKRSPGGYYHLQLCPQCTRKNRGVKLTDFFCIGYWVGEEHLRTPACPKKKQLRHWEVNRLQYQKDRNPNSRFDQASRTYQCDGCWFFDLNWTKRKKKLIEHVAGKHPKEKVGRIRNLEQLRKLMSEHTRCVNPNLIEAGTKILKSRPRKSGYVAPGVTRAHLIRNWSGKDLPKNVRLGICIFCGKIAIRTGKAPKFNDRCYHEWLGTPEGRNFQSLKARGLKASLPPSKAGHPVTEDSLKTSWAYAIQYCFGEETSYRTIAEKYGVHFTSMSYGIKFLIDRLDPQLLRSPFDRAAELVLDAYRERCSARVASATPSDSIGSFD